MFVDISEVLPGLVGPNTSNRGSRELAANHPERRTRVRTTVHWPILFFRSGSEEMIESVTQNLSSSGFYCHSRLAITPGEAVRCVLKIPSHDPSGYERPRLLECRIRVMRLEPANEGTFGIACQIQDYHLMVGEDRHEPAPRDH